MNNLLNSLILQIKKLKYILAEIEQKIKNQNDSNSIINEKENQIKLCENKETDNIFQSNLSKNQNNDNINIQQNMNTVDYTNSLNNNKNLNQKSNIENQTQKILEINSKQLIDKNNSNNSSEIQEKLKEKLLSSTIEKKLQKFENVKENKLINIIGDDKDRYKDKKNQMKAFIYSLNNLDFNPLDWPNTYQCKNGRTYLFRKIINGKLYQIRAPLEFKENRHINDHILKNLIKRYKNQQDLDEYKIKIVMDRIYNKDHQI